jgi:hypothetical protein
LRITFRSSALPRYFSAGQHQRETLPRQLICPLQASNRFGSKRFITGIEGNMRSDLVYAANLQVHNRFLLASTVMRAVRKMHVEATRTEDTINRVFSEVANSREIIGKLPEIIPPPAIEALLIA